MENKRPIIIFCSFILLAGLALLRTLSFSLSGDDWFTLYRFINTYHGFKDYFSFNSFSTNYDVANIILGWIYTFAGNRPIFFYIASFLLRICMGLSLYWLLNKFSVRRVRNSFIAGGAIVLFAGAESVSWVFNMNTFIAISLFFGLVYSHYSYAGVKRIILVSTLIFGAFLTAPTRMHGLLLAIPLLVLLFHSSKRQLVLLPIIYLTPVILFRIIFQTNSDTEFPKDAFFHMTSPMFWKTLLLSLSDALLPDKLIAIPLFLKYISILCLAILFYLSRLNKLVVFFICSSVAFLLMPQILNFQSIFPSEHRYLLLPSVLLWTGITFYITKTFSRVNTLFVFIAGSYLSINCISSFIHFDFLYKNGRNAHEVDGYMRTMNSVLMALPVNKPSLILIEGNNPSRIYNALQFGFTLKILVLYPQFRQKSAPFVVEDLKSLKMILDGDDQEIARYGYLPYDFNVSDVYAFELIDTELTDKTDQLRSKLNN